MAVAFDTLRAATQLQEAGFREAHAHALVTFAEDVTENLVTKDDLASTETTLDMKIDRVNADLSARIDKVDAKVDQLEAKMDAEFGKVYAEFDGVRSEMAVLKRDIVIWLGGLMITMTGLVVAATSVLG